MEINVENINIDKHKELFEYEMTEVILKLKGEFAAFSGKDTRFAEMVVDDAKLHINTSEVVRVRMSDCHVEAPAIGSVQQTETARVEVKGTTLQLPVVPRILDEDGRKEEKVYSLGKANIKQGIAVSSIPSIGKVEITTESIEKSLENVEKKFVFSVKVPQLVSAEKNLQNLKKKEYATFVSIHVPKTKIKYSAWNRDNSSIHYQQRKIQKAAPVNMGFDSLKMSSQLTRLSKVCAVNRTEVRVPHTATETFLCLKNGNKNAISMVEVSVHVPKTIIKYRSWSKDKLSVHYEKNSIQKSVLEDLEFDSLRISSHLINLTKVCAVNKAEIRVPYIATNMMLCMENSKNTEKILIEVPQVEYAKGYLRVIPGITCESVQIDVSSMPSFDPHELKTVSETINKKQIEFQGLQGYKNRIKNLTVTRDVVNMPDLKHIPQYKYAEVSKKYQILLVPDVPNCNKKSKNIDIKRTKLGVFLPVTEIPKQQSLKTNLVLQSNILKVTNVSKVKKKKIPDVQKSNIAVLIPDRKVRVVNEIPNIVDEMEVVTVYVPEKISIIESKTVLITLEAVKNIAIPDMTKMHFSKVPIVEHSRPAREIKINPVRVNGELDKVEISYHGAITIPQKPTISEDVYNIIALVAAKR